jgi:hypothetical protein
MANLNEILSVMRAPVNVDVDPMGSFLDAREAQRRYENMGSQDQRAQAFLKIQQAQEARAAAEQQRQIEAVAAKKALDEKMKQQALTEQLARLKAAGYSDEEIQARAKLWGVPLESGPAPSLGVMGGLMPQAPAPEADISWADMAAGPQGGQAMGDAERAQLESQVFGAPLAAPVMPPAQPSVSDQELLGAMPRRPARVPPRQLGVMGGLGGGDQQAVLEAIGAPEPMQAPAQPMQAAQPGQPAQAPGRAPLMFNGISLEDLQPQSTTSDFVEKVRTAMPQYEQEATVAESTVNKMVLMGEIDAKDATKSINDLFKTLVDAKVEFAKMEAQKKPKGGGGGLGRPSLDNMRVDPKVFVRGTPENVRAIGAMNKLARQTAIDYANANPMVKGVKKKIGEMNQALIGFQQRGGAAQRSALRSFIRMTDDRISDQDYKATFESAGGLAGLHAAFKKWASTGEDAGELPANMRQQFIDYLAKLSDVNKKFLTRKEQEAEDHIVDALFDEGGVGTGSAIITEEQARRKARRFASLIVSGEALRPEGEEAGDEEKKAVLDEAAEF